MNSNLKQTKTVRENLKKSVWLNRNTKELVEMQIISEKSWLLELKSIFDEIPYFEKVSYFEDNFIKMPDREIAILLYGK